MYLLITLATGLLLFSPYVESQSEVVKIRGRIVCVDSTETESSEAMQCPASRPNFAFLDENGRLHRFLPSDSKLAMFSDSRVLERKLQITGSLTSLDQLEIIRVQSILECGLHHLYYRCEVCNITAFASGPCWCCQEEFEFRETVVPPPQ